jgi:hypothetical protein
VTQTREALEVAFIARSFKIIEIIMLLFRLRLIIKCFVYLRIAFGMTVVLKPVLRQEEFRAGFSCEYYL